MAIKSTTFGRVQLSGDDAARFAELVRTKQTNPNAKRTLKRGRAALAKMRAAAC
ncbi:hypothetical protein [Photobacterium sanguinicancri]|uniref:hypothetical protein n=1 Tax=Photobacterium sanguinicancri TaxID=875932 RepID=UPI002480312F|nr:hypothetical protein [Photobacterium sanguinicancri]